MSSNKYIKRFDTESEYYEFHYSNEYIRPNLSYVDETDNIHINELDCLKFTAKESNSTVKLTRVGSSSSLANAVLQYSTDGLTWNNYPLNTAISLSNINNYVLFKGNNTRLGYDNSNYHQFVMTGKVAASGPISSLTSPDNRDKTLVSYIYYKLFYNCTSLTEAPVLPATTLATYCYSYMFSNCTSLTTAPILPATTLENNCYYAMFSGCTNLNYIKAMFITTPSSSNTPSWVSGVAATGTFIKNSAAEWDVTGVNGIPSGWTVEYAAA